VAPGRRGGVVDLGFVAAGFGEAIRMSFRPCVLVVPTAVAAICCSGIAATASPSSAAAGTAQIKRVWIEFFSGSTSAAVKIRLLQDGQRLAPVIKAQAGSPLAKQTTVTVKFVTLTGRNTARVVYTIKLAGKPALTNQIGTAVRIGGTWKVGLRSFCRLLALEGPLPPACRG